MSCRASDDSPGSRQGPRHIVRYASPPALGAPPIPCRNPLRVFGASAAASADCGRE